MEEEQVTKAEIKTRLPGSVKDLLIKDIEMLNMRLLNLGFIVRQIEAEQEAIKQKYKDPKLRQVALAMCGAKRPIAWVVARHSWLRAWRRWR